MRRLGLVTLVLAGSSGLRSVEGSARGGATLKDSIENRIMGRTYPSVFQAWSPAEAVRSSNPLTVVARHDLLWHGVGWYGLRWDASPQGLGRILTPESIEKGRVIRQTLLKLNPNIILVAEIRYRDASRRFLPKDHEWWARDEDGQPAKGWAEGGFIRLDFANPEYRRHVARRAKAVVQSGVVDGILLDWWRDDEDRLALIRQVRKAIGDDYLIIANANDRTTPKTAPYINGYFMECTRSRTAQDWQRIRATLTWAETHLRRPAVNCLEIWYHHSRDDLNLMRAATTLSLTQSNGYCLFSDPNPLPTADHLHNWYPFWDKSLGRPVSTGVARADGTVTREFENGTVVYNPMGNRAVSVVFDDIRQSVATGTSARRHQLADADGDIFLRRPAVSGDGR